MKTQTKKIIIGAAALLFAISGVSFADNRDDRHHKPHGKAYGHHKANKQSPQWDNKHLKPLRHHRDRYTSEKAHHGPYYENHHHRWEKKHVKSRRPNRNRSVYKRAHRHHENYHRRRAQREDLIYKAVLRDPGIVFKVILKEHGLF